MCISVVVVCNAACDLSVCEMCVGVEIYNMYVCVRCVGCDKCVCVMCQIFVLGR